jgi:hypothetical protein
MRQLLLATTTCGILLGLGIYHGLATDRWTQASGDTDPGKCFANLPLSFDDWVGERLPRGEGDDDKNSVLTSRFINRINGRWVLTSITSGRAGRVSIHDPEHCYLGSGYKVVDAIRQESFDLPSGKTAKFWTGHFEKKKPSGIESIRIYWGWTVDGQWQAPDYPRLLFAGKATLHKLYMIHPVSQEDEEDSTPFRDFMIKYVTELNRHFEQ